MEQSSSTNRNILVLEYIIDVNEVVFDPLESRLITNDGQFQFSPVTSAFEVLEQDFMS